MRLRTLPITRSIPFYVFVWALAAVMAAAGFAALSLILRDQVAERQGLLTLLLFLVITAASEAFNIRLHHGRSEEVITLVEAAVAANILIFPPLEALGISVGGITLAHVIQRRAPIKLLFNVSQYSVAAIAAVTLSTVIGGLGPLGPRRFIGVAMGIAAFGAVNSSALAGLVAILEDRSFRTIIKEGARLSSINVLGNAAVGILAGAIWRFSPPLTVVLLIPAFTLRLAYRGVVQVGELLERMRVERDRLDRVIAGASDGIILLDSEGTVKVWSPGAEQLTGISAGDAVDKRASEVLSGKDHTGAAVDLLQPLKDASPDRATSAVEMTLINSTGEERIALTRHTILFDDRGRTSGDVILIQDVTRQREVEKMKDDFVARVSHELRTPLTPIRGYAQTLLRKGEDVSPEARRKALEVVLERTEHMGRLIEDLLLVTRISSGRAGISEQIRSDRVNIGLLCDGLVGEFRRNYPGRRFEFQQPDPPIHVFGDPTRIEQILANILSNACKYSEEGQPISIGVEKWPDSEVKISVEDRGRGITADQLDRIFERFHRVEDPLTMTTGGLGMGLYISRQLAEAMGGNLLVKSRPGEGSTFILVLPLAPP